MKQKTRVNGWKPIPLSIKIVFVVLVLDLLHFVVINLWRLFSGTLPVKTPFTTLKFITTVILLVAIYMRYRWTWRYAIFYFIFLIAGTIYTVWPLANIALKMAQSADFTAKIYGQTIIISTVLQVVIELMMFFVVFWKRKYFS